MPRTLTFDKGFRLFMKALSLNGTRIGVTRAEVDLSGNCLAPRTVEYVGRRETFLLKHHVVTPAWNDPTTWESVSVIMSCKCRQCETCLRKKRIHWFFRAKAEMSVSPRTWFGTLTFSPENVVKGRITAERWATRRGYLWGELDDERKFKALLHACAAEVTLFQKRVRKNSGAQVRFLIVSERHKSGLPHFHCLVHEASAVQIPHRILKGAWQAGFSDFKLAEPKAAGYVAKYISKDVAARVRASERYGDTSVYNVSPRDVRSASEDTDRGRERKKSLGKEEANRTL